MSTRALTREELIEFVRQNFDPEDIWSAHELETDHDECYLGLTQALSAAEDEGWVNPSDPRTYDPWHVEQMTDHLGLTVGHRTRTIEAYHDTQGHTGAVQWCKHPMCSREEN